MSFMVYVVLLEFIGEGGLGLFRFRVFVIVFLGGYDFKKL